MTLRLVCSAVLAASTLPASPVLASGGGSTAARGGTRVVSNPVTASTSVVYLGPEQKGSEAAQRALAALQLAEREVINPVIASTSAVGLGPGDTTQSEADGAASIRIGKARKAYGSLKYITTEANDESRVCRALAPLYERQYRTHVEYCSTSTYSFNRREDVYSLNIRIREQDAKDLQQNFGTVWLDGTTQEDVDTDLVESETICGTFHFNDVGSSEVRFRVLVRPLRLSMKSRRKAGSC